MKYTIGIDAGSTNTKGVLYDGDQIVKQIILPTGARPRLSIQEVYEFLYLDQVEYVVTTGYGRNLCDVADRQITEITCHGAGAAWLNPSIRGVIDIGGQDSKAIVLNDQHKVTDFLMNDKCAAGTGRFVEIMMNLLETPIEELDDFVVGKEPIQINSMCTVFAESEIISLLAEEADPAEIALGVLHSICKRTCAFVQKLPMQDHLFFSGGLSRSKVFTRLLGSYLGCELHTDAEAPFAGAIGAALLGYRTIS